MAENQTFAEHLRVQFGDKWVLAPRLTERLRAKGYTVALSQREYRIAQVTWAQECANLDPRIAAAAEVLRDHNAREAAEALARYTLPA